tara:strand:+ start:135 stop:782 length:648 start_codon:yes stop_codon:yes gene_type:complete
MRKNYYIKYLKNTYFLAFIILTLFFSIFFVKYFDHKNKIEFASCNINTSIEKFDKFNDGFNLIHEDGYKISRKKLINQPSLIYFGYTFCPDICPFDLMRNSQVVDLLTDEDIKIKPLFVTLDPKRDTLEILKEYTDFHHKDMIGLTGSNEQIDTIKKIFMIYSQMPNDISGDYIINHSTFSYFILPDMGLITYFTRKDNVEKISNTIKCILENNK